MKAMPILDREDSIRPYLEDIQHSQPLSREKEVQLSARIKRGDMKARDELVQANLRFVLDVARVYQNRGLPFADLISAGNVGLMTASERFDGTKGFKFISYAVWWIRQSIQQAVSEHVRTVRLPVNRIALLHNITKASRRLEQKHEGEPNIDEIAEELEMPVDVIAETVLSGRPISSLDGTDTQMDDNDNLSLANVLPDTNQRAPDADLMYDSARKHLEATLTCLDKREKRIIQLYFGLTNEEPLTLEEIGTLFKLTRERIRQLKERALQKLRAPLKDQYFESNRTGAFPSPPLS